MTETCNYSRPHIGGECIYCERDRLKALVKQYQKLAAGETCPYDKGECDGKAALRSLVRELRLILRDNHAIAFTGEFVRAVASLDERTVETLNRSEVREIVKEVEDG